jgi:hypothetical protein
MPMRKSVSVPYPASPSTMPTGIPSACAWRICCDAIAALVSKLIPSGTPALARRAASPAQVSGR